MNLRRTRIRRVSKKRAKKLRDRQPLRDALQRRSGGRCEVRFSPYCTGVGQGPHHKKKESQGGSDTLENCLWSCNIRNSAIEDEPLRARAEGLVVLSWEPEA